MSLSTRATEAFKTALAFGMAEHLVLNEIGIEPAVGIGLTFISLKLMKVAHARGWITQIWGQLPVIALAISCFAVAQTLHGSGYIASFCGGLLFGFLPGKKPISWSMLPKASRKHWRC